MLTPVIPIALLTGSGAAAADKPRNLEPDPL
jgi:hypothetical protein